MKVRMSLAAAAVAVAAMASLTPAHAIVGVGTPGQKALGVAIRGQQFRMLNASLSPQSYTINGKTISGVQPGAFAVYTATDTATWGRDAGEPIAGPLSQEAVSINGSPAGTLAVVGQN